MRSLNNRLVLIKMRRLFELLTLTLFVVIVLTISSKWSSTRTTTTDNYKHLNVHNNNIPVNPFLPQDNSLNLNDKIMIERPINGRPNLVKYIHLDLKGAPPQANKFYENFFDFIDKIQMGVKGVLIEYEDMLPLQGRFTNVSINKKTTFSK